MSIHKQFPKTDKRGRQYLFSADGAIGIPLSSGEYAWADEADFVAASSIRWSASYGPNTCYAINSHGFYTPSGRKTSLLHRLLLDPESSSVHVDHADGNGLNNRRSNIRIASRSQNMSNWTRTNKTGFRGVAVKKNSSSFLAQIKVESRCIYLGSFLTAEAAARAYDAAAISHYGDFAILNFPPPQGDSPVRSCDGLVSSVSPGFMISPSCPQGLGE
jgi:hypothetical protein